VFSFPFVKNDIILKLGWHISLHTTYLMVAESDSFAIPAVLTRNIVHYTAFIRVLTKG